ncbi:MAG: HAD hydrolase family protein [Gammaproteobacteria bacterium]|nr:HAD hydrolase family protein [Gammaproteobacteria bacterium]
MKHPGTEIFPASALALARDVDLLILDVDGVMTDGRIYYADSKGLSAGAGAAEKAAEMKAFFAQDGAAIKMLQAAGIPVAVISGRSSGATARRVSELGIAHAYQGVEDKTAALGRLCSESGIMAERMAHAGDDIPDLPLFDRVGMRLSVREAHPEVAARADYVTAAGGGAGAVREICHLILVAKGLWASALAEADAWPR